ncbi:MAG: HAMP domain-containing histidine kinase [Deltaproteobacteria bacterium]|nr:HAMP domain-containing histidine kinase [Deltaproteobacteria bacterium]MCR5219822.1 HAMP domain-containing histidine kinase [bacterium]
MHIPRILKKVFHPLVIFIVVQLAWFLVVWVWLTWFLGGHNRLQEITARYWPELTNKSGLSWMVMAEGLVLLLTILAGVYVIFLYWSRQSALLREQKSFIAQVSHELKSPVASIRLHLETLQLRQPPPEQFAKSLDIMLAESSRLNSLINNLLAANRMEFQRFPLALRRCNLSALTTEYFREAAGHFPGELSTSIDADLAAQLDPESLRLIFRNLVENAILYAQGPPALTVTLRREGKWCHLQLKDKGRGLSSQDLKKIFRMFYRVRKTGDGIHGTGLGLFIVQLLVRRQRGKIWAESAGEGQGSTFHILLPRCA